MGLREEKKRELRDRILATTLSLFGKQGFGSTRVADVAAQLRISEATFFNYFPTKHAVLDEAVRAAVDAAVTRGLAAHAHPGLTALSDVGTELAAEFSTERPVGHLLARHPTLVNAAVFADEPPVPLIAFFADAQARGLARKDIQPQVLSATFLAVLWVAGRPAFGESEPALVDALRRGADLFIGGLAPHKRRSR